MAGCIPCCPGCGGCGCGCGCLGCGCPTMSAMNPMAALLQQQQMAMMMSPMAGMMQMNPMASMMQMNPMAMGMMPGATGQMVPPVDPNALAFAGQEELPEEEEEEDPYPPGPSPNINHPHYRPPDMEVVPGLTDRRFVGVMYLWFEDKGFGFIECPDITKKFGQDAFLHRTQRKNFKRGQYVSFSVYLNYRGKLSVQISGLWVEEAMLAVIKSGFKKGIRVTANSAKPGLRRPSFARRKSRNPRRRLRPKRRAATPGPSFLGV
eukprot:s783_g13.t1